MVRLGGEPADDCRTSNIRFVSAGAPGWRRRMTNFDLYNRQILTLAGSVPRLGRLDSPSASVTARSPLCGSRVTVHVKLSDGMIADYAHEVRACVIGRAVASAVAGVIVGLPVTNIHEGAKALRALLKNKTLPPSEPWTVLEPFLPVADVRSRHGSAQLVFDALERALDEINHGATGQQLPSVTFDQELRA